MPSATWVLEPDIFPETHEPIRHAIREFGLALIDWSDSWWADGVPSSVPANHVVFHGSLGNAAQISSQLNWAPGSFCPTGSFHCSSWYESDRKWLVHADWHFAAANELVANAQAFADQLSSPDRLFVRPDSPLKPFSGRVVETAELSLTKLDHGFYYDDEALPVVIAPVRHIGNEWRFVIVSCNVVAGSAYDPATRKAVTATLDSAAADFAADVASSIPAPADVYVLDICECDGALRLLELNPFGGADLYACDPKAIIQAVSDVAAST
jgi:hypothetical protein